MNESGQNFEELKKLLKLKRHEIPPPGYFNHFSDGVISRIRAGEARGDGSLADRLNDSAPWLVNFLRIFEAKPGVVGGFATSLCLLLLFGVVLAEHSENTPKNAIGETVAAATPSTSAVAAAGTSTMPDLAGVSLASDGGIAISTNASLQPVASLFGQPAANPFLQPAAFAPAH
jgi:hypothetical protein